VPGQIGFACLLAFPVPRVPAVFMRRALACRRRRQPAILAARRSAGTRAEPRRCHIVVVLTTTMSHRRGCAGPITGDTWWS